MIAPDCWACENVVEEQEDDSLDQLQLSLKEGPLVAQQQTTEQKCWKNQVR